MSDRLPPEEWISRVADVCRITGTRRVAAEQILGAAFIASQTDEDGTVDEADLRRRLDLFTDLLEVARFDEYLPAHEEGES